MRLQVVIRYIGIIFLFNAVFMFISFIISAFNGGSDMNALLFSTLFTTIMGFFPLIFVPAATHLSNKESYLIVVLSWILSCLISSIPYLLWGGEFTFTNAFFESVSGYTTAGCSILTNVEALPKGLLFWRASTHFMGGIGIVVFAMLIIPTLAKSNLSVTKQEISDLAKENFKYKTATILRILLYVYLGITVVSVLVLTLMGMPIFDAVCHSFASVATGGFSVKNVSIAYYNNVYIELFISFICMIAGIHFGVLFLAFTGKFNRFFNNEATRYYVSILFIATIVIGVDLWVNHYHDFWLSMRHSSFQVISFMSSTGFASAKSEDWPMLSILILSLVSLIGACSGSTGGAIKVDRVMIFFKNIKRTFKRLMHPNAIIPIRVDKMTLREELVEMASTFIVIYLVFAFISTCLLVIMGVDIVDAITGSIATLGNIGPGFGTVGSFGNYSAIPDAGKWLFSFNMLLGRLEIYGLLMLIAMRFWK